MPEPISKLVSRCLTMPEANIDTDQIIPARYLTTVSRIGLGEHLFADRRHAPPFDDTRAASCSILVAGDNFGCGSSREHAAWALADYGVRAVISTRIADIFRANAIKNGIVPIEITTDDHGFLTGNPWIQAELDLPNRCIRVSDRVIRFEIDEFHAHCLTRGIDELDFLSGHGDRITEFEETRR